MEKSINQQLADAMSQVAENLNKAAAIPNAQNLHGQGGLLAGQGIDRNVITAMIRPQGIGSVLPLIPSVYETRRSRLSSVLWKTAQTVRKSRVPMRPLAI